MYNFNSSCNQFCCPLIDELRKVKLSEEYKLIKLTSFFNWFLIFFSTHWSHRLFCSNKYRPTLKTIDILFLKSLFH